MDYYNWDAQINAFMVNYHDFNFGCNRVVHSKELKPSIISVGLNQAVNFSIEDISIEG